MWNEHTVRAVYQSNGWQLIPATPFYTTRHADNGRCGHGLRSLARPLAAHSWQTETTMPDGVVCDSCLSLAGRQRLHL